VAVCLALACAAHAVAAETPIAPAASTAQEDAIKQIDEMIAKAAVDKSAGPWKTQLPKPGQATFDAKRAYFADVSTNKGNLRIKFMPDVAPMHVTNFIYLSRLGFFDDLKFHRVIPGFMAQGGCPLGTGTGSPGYRFDGEFRADVKHDRGGLLSMANAGPGTDGSQFFLTFVPTPWLDGKHTIFGEVVSGMETLKAIEPLGSRSGQTSETVKITSVKIAVE
jgi:cyclophilin family peptidyl-prolyl cis-trans isomerase